MRKQVNPEMQLLKIKSENNTNIDEIEPPKMPQVGAMPSGKKDAKMFFKK